jgi:hypothetical protein
VVFWNAFIHYKQETSPTAIEMRQTETSTQLIHLINVLKNCYVLKSTQLRYHQELTSYIYECETDYEPKMGLEIQIIPRASTVT